MKKRAVSMFLVLVISFLALEGRILRIILKPETAISGAGLRTEAILYTRGKIYDCNQKPLTENSWEYVACILPTANGMRLVATLPNGKELQSELKKGKPVHTTVPNADFARGEADVLVLKSFHRYSDNLLPHVLGYTDSSGAGVCGIEKSCDALLEASGGSISLAYHTDALGRMLTGEDAEVRDENYNGKSGILLTIDADIQRITENALKNGNILPGAAVVLDIKTGEIRAMASTPVFERSNPAAALTADNAPFVNRALSAFSVGSVFKVVTAAAALQNGIPLPNYRCEGYTALSGTVFHCSHREGHGLLSFREALAVSCNPYFINLSAELGAEKLLDTAQRLGFGREIVLAAEMAGEAGSLPEVKALNSDAAVGNLGFGQGSLLATPLQIAACYAAIANDGIYHTPTLLKEKIDRYGIGSPYPAGTAARAVSPETAQRLRDALQYAVEEGTGTLAKSKLFSSCGKTATAETGQRDENGAGISHTWFAGFFPADSPQYAVCILKENGASGASDDAPVFKEISENIFKLLSSRQQLS